MSQLASSAPVSTAIAIFAAIMAVFLFRRSVSHAALRASEEQYRLLFENSPQPMWFCDQQTERILEVNVAATRAYGFTREEFLSMEAGALLVQEAAEAAAPDGVWRHRRKDGEVLEVETTVHATRFQGRPAQFIVIRDITKQQKAQREILRLNHELACSAKEMETVFQSAPVGLAIATDPSCNELRANAYLEKLLRITPNTNISMTRAQGTDVPYRILHQGKSVPLSEFPIRKAIDTGLAAGPSTFVFEFSDGAKREVVFQAEPLLDENGKVRGCVGSFVDITQNRRVEAALRESEERFRKVFYEAPLGMRLVSMPSLDGVAVNEALCRMLGYDAEEIRTMSYPGVTHPDDLVLSKKLIDRLSSGEAGPHQVEKRYIRKDGAVVPVSLSGATLRDEAGEITHLLYMVEDITVRKRLEQQLRESQKMEAIGRLAGGIAHDFNNLLTIILGHASLAMSGANEDMWLQGSILEIQKAGERAAGLTRQLLAFSRKQVLQPRLVNLTELISELSETVQRLVGDDIRLALKLQTGPGTIRADQGQLEQVIFNLAVNARDAMPMGGALAIEVTDADWKGASCVRLTISDTGCGMDADTRSRIFEPFFTTKELGKGTGLGLSTVYGIIEQSGGSIEVRSQVGEGAAFDIYLPRQSGVSETRSTVRPPAGQAGGGTVLLVEDEEGIRRLVAELLRKAGYSVLEAASGPDALEELRRSHRTVDLLVTDVTMPEMSGPALAAEIVRTLQPVRVLFLSGYTEHPSFHGETLKEGSAFLHKPFTSADLLAQVATLLARK